jgi:quercetin dioxygenase-like cupin family protein
MKNRWAVPVVSMLTLVGLLAVVRAQQPTINRVVLQRGDLSTPGREAVMARGEFPVSGATGLHTHPGEEITYLLEGTLRLEVEGQPPRTLKAGDVFMIPAGKVHGATNIGNGGATAIVTYVVEKGKPLTTPATPAP